MIWLQFGLQGLLQPVGAVFGLLRDFYHQVRTGLGKDYRAASKITNGVMLFSEAGHGVEIPSLETFLDQEQLCREAVQQQAIAMRVNTPFADMLYDLQRNPANPRRICVVSHLDLSNPLGELIAQTHLDRGFGSQAGAIVTAQQEHSVEYTNQP